MRNHKNEKNLIFLQEDYEKTFKNFNFKFAFKFFLNNIEIFFNFYLKIKIFHGEILSKFFNNERVEKTL
jgi:hypothetical protein